MIRENGFQGFWGEARHVLASLAFLVGVVIVPGWVKGDDARVVEILEGAIGKHGVPAIGAMVVNSEGVVAMGVAGVRKAGTDVAVTLEDKWHLGSNTKAMTATLIGRLVDEGKLRWDSTLEEIFPEIENMHESFKSVTVLQILTHRGGFLANLPWGIIPRTGDMAKVRHDAISLALTMEPAFEPGVEVTYSNLGYVVAGAIVEKLRGEAWEEAIRRELFEPLGMTSAGFGVVGTPGELDQPWPHYTGKAPAPTNGPEMDNPPVLGPAGRVHCSLADYGKFLAEHLRAGKGEGALLSAESFERLHTPPFGDAYGLGWIVVERSWAGGVAMTHSGSNTVNYSVVWMAPEKDRAFVAVMNVGIGEGPAIADEVVTSLVLEFLAGD